MKKMYFLVLSFLLLSIAGVHAQVTIGADAEPQRFSILELVSNGETGLRLPQLTIEERDALMETDEFIAAMEGSALGLMIYNVENRCIEIWNGKNPRWRCVGAPVSIPDIVVTSPMEVEVGKPLTLTATEPVTWSIIDGNGFAELNGNTVTVSAVGSIVMRASAADGRYTDFTITVKASSDATHSPGIVMTSAAETEVNRLLFLTATVNPILGTNTDVFWTIVDGSRYASLIGNLLIAGNTPIEITVRATTTDGKLYNDFYITIIPAPTDVLMTNITITGPTLVSVGDIAGYSVQSYLPVNATNTGVTWEATNGLFISSNGVLSTATAGSGTITAKAISGVAVSNSIPVTIVADPIMPNSVTVRGSGGITSASVDEGSASFQLTATVLPTGASQGVTWSIQPGGTSATTVDQTGLVTPGNTAGTATVVATSTANGSVSGIFTVTVNSTVPTLTSITVTAPGGSSADVGQSVTLNAAPDPSNAVLGAVTWAIVPGGTGTGTFNNNVLTGTGEGTVFVTATSNGVTSASFTVTFTDGRFGPPGLKIYSVSMGTWAQANIGCTSPSRFPNVTDLHTVLTANKNAGYVWGLPDGTGTSADSAPRYWSSTPEFGTHNIVNANSLSISTSTGGDTDIFLYICVGP